MLVCVQRTSLENPALRAADSGARARAQLERRQSTASSCARESARRAQSSDARAARHFCCDSIVMAAS